MPKRKYSCQEVALTHTQMVELRGSGDLNLGIINDIAVRIGNTEGMGEVVLENRTGC